MTVYYWWCSASLPLSEAILRVSLHKWLIFNVLQVRVRAPGRAPGFLGAKSLTWE